MPALVLTDFIGTITWLGVVPERVTPEIETRAFPSLAVDFAGIEGSVHGGEQRPSCSRVLGLYPTKGTTIANTRQISIVCQDELALIAQEMGLERIDPAWLGATIVVAGIPDFSHLPPSTRLQAPDGATLTVDMQNRPCHFPGRTIEAVFTGKGGAFKSAAKHRRGVTAWVECPGTLRLGQSLRVFSPDQRPWQP